MSPFKAFPGSCFVARLPNTANPASIAIAASIEQALRQRRLVMILCHTREDPAIQGDCLLEMHAHPARGIALPGAVDNLHLDDFIAANEHPAFVNRRLATDRGIPFVGIDNCQADAAVADIFVERDLCPTCVIHVLRNGSATAERIGGFLDRRCVTGRTIAPRVVVSRASLNRLQFGYDAMGQLMQASIRPGPISPPAI